ncbi:hypothetical protein ACRAWF_25885 [Streptomyces sp. L7]
MILNRHVDPAPPISHQPLWKPALLTTRRQRAQTAGSFSSPPTSSTPRPSEWPRPLSAGPTRQGNRDFGWVHFSGPHDIHDEKVIRAAMNEHPEHGSTKTRKVYGAVPVPLGDQGPPQVQARRHG